MNELNQRLYDNYVDEVKEYLEFLKSKGYVLLNDFGTTNIRVNQYNAKTGKFTAKYQMFDMPKFIKESVTNYYNFDVDNDIINLVKTILPQLEHKEISEYLSYLKYAENPIDTKELKKEYKEIKKLSKNIDTDIDKTVFNLPFNQAIVLNRNGVIFCDVRDMSKGYYLYNKKNNKFKKLNDTDIIGLLADGFNVSKNKFKTFEVLKHMKNTYMNYLIKTDLPKRWNENVKAQNIMNEYKDSYKSVKKVTDNFI